MILQPQVVQKPKFKPPRPSTSQLEMPDETQAIVILSGGMDSATVLAYAVDLWGANHIYALTFDYGQRHRKEIEAAKALATHFKVPIFEFKIDMRPIGGSALTSDISVPPGTEETPKVVPSTYVPMRNTIFLAIASAYAEVLGCSFVYYGANWIDSGGYPDCRPQFVSAFNAVLLEGSKFQPTVSAPLINSTKKQIVEEGEKFHVPWHLTWSCYEGGEHPCGVCNACVQRAKGFREAGVIDPLVTSNQTPSETTQESVVPEKTQGAN